MFYITQTMKDGATRVPYKDTARLK